MDHSDTTEILFSEGAYALAYQSGFAKYLLDLVGKEELKKYHFGGVSSGAAVSGYLFTAVNSDSDMSYMYDNFVKPFYTSENTYGLFPW